MDIPRDFREPEELGLDPRPEPLRRWLAELPLANAEQCANDVLTVLDKVNRARLKPEQRLALLQVVQPTAETLAETLRGQFGQALLPLNPRNLARLRAAQDLHQAVARGCNILIQQRSADENGEDRSLFVALYLALHHLTLSLLEAYTVYFPEPQGVWSAINELYRFAEGRGGHNFALPVDSEAGEPASVSLAFRRAALLALASPHRLAPGEAWAVHKLLRGVAQGARVLGPLQQCPGACLYVDLKADAPPRFAPEVGRIGAVEPRLFDLGRVLQALEKRIEALRTGKGETVSKMSRYERHKQRDMLERLRTSWGRTRDREDERLVSLGNVTAAVGLSASHHFIAGEAAFTPELDEVRIHTGKAGGGGGGLGLSLLPRESEPWKAEEAETRLDSGVENPRRSSFDSEDDALDVWEKIYATRAKHDPHKANGPLYQATRWKQKNASLGGLCLFCETEQGMPLRVGEVIAYRPDSDAEHWMVGTIRWLQVQDNRSVQMGLMTLADSARCVATRAVKGVGQGGEYFRALLTPSTEVDAATSSLIVPGAIYESGSTLALNTGERICYVELGQMLESTAAFARFRFKQVEMPASENQNVDALRALL